MPMRWSRALYMKANAEIKGERYIAETEKYIAEANHSTNDETQHQKLRSIDDANAEARWDAA